MIIDKLENLGKYTGVHPRFAKAIPFLISLAKGNPSDGRHEMPDCDIEGAIYANVLTYDTKPLSDASRMEYHQRYIDIQIVAQGREVMLYPTAEGEACIRVTDPFEKTQDYALLTVPPVEKTVQAPIPEGHFVIFFPNELHAPGLSAGDASTSVRKIVGKVLF